MLSHAITDMKEIAMADMDIVVHMLSHTDWERHADVMEDIFKASEAEGLEVWVDNWGICRTDRPPVELVALRENRAHMKSR